MVKIFSESIRFLTLLILYAFLLTKRLLPLASLLGRASDEPSLGFSAALNILTPKSSILIPLKLSSNFITDHPTDVIPISSPNA